MKKMLPLVFTLFSLLLSGTFLLSSAQGEENKKIKKEIEIEQNNDETTVTITETKNGKTTRKILSGKEAEAYIENEQSDQTYVYHITTDDNGKSEIVVEEFKTEDSDHEMIWIEEVDDNIHVSQENTDELRKALNKLQDELDELNKKEIAARLEEIVEIQEEMDKIIEVNMIKGGDHNVKVNEEDGVITIERTINGTTTTETIDLDEEEGSSKKVMIIKSEETK